MAELVETLRATNAILIVISATHFAVYITLLFRNFGGKK